MTLYTIIFDYKSGTYTSQGIFMKKLYAVLAISSSLLLGSQATAQTVVTSPVQATKNATPSRDSLVRLAQLMNLENEARKGFEMGFRQSLMSSSMSSKNIEKLTPSQKQAVEKLVKEFGDNVLRDIYTPEFSQWMLEQNMSGLAETFNQQEVDAMIAFYQTDVGQKIISKQIPFMQNVTKRLTGDEILKQAKFESIAQKYAKDFEKNLKTVVKK